MTKKQMKEELIQKVKFYAKHARKYWSKATVEDIEKGNSPYSLYREYQARALEIINIMLMLHFISEDECNELMQQTIQTSMAM